jgi:hypothetical protein
MRDVVGPAAPASSPNVLSRELAAAARLARPLLAGDGDGLYDHSTPLRNLLAQPL